MYKNIPCYFAGLILSLSAHAEDSISADLFNQLQQDIQKYSEIATETKQNVDYMPYVVSVLTATELEQLGIVTLREALAIIPGVDMSVGMAGIKNPILRGSNPYAFGQSKLVIDGVAVNDSLFGGYSQYLEMPTQIIQRIEVVRGPGSLLSHVNGYAGSIHVITKANRDDGFARPDDMFAATGSHDYKMAGFNASHVQGDFEVNTDLFYQEHDLTLPVGADLFGNSGDTNQSLENYHLGVNASFENFQLKSRFAQNNSGVSYGQSFSFSQDPTDYLDIGNNYIELSYTFEINAKINVIMALGYFDENRQLQNKMMPDSVMLPGGRYFLVDYSEQTLFQQLEFKINTFDQHSITSGLFLYQSDIGDNIGSASIDGLLTFTTAALLEDTDRNLVSFYIDDLINVSEKTSMQVGLKFDQYNDVDNQLSPRVAYVYRYDDDNIYKLMYTGSYREPSWREQYLMPQPLFNATRDVEEETVDAYEAAYIHKTALHSHIKLNVFYLENKDQIHAQNPANAFDNSGDGELYGLEMEYKTRLLNKDQFYLNYSFVDGNNVGDELANSARNMIKGYYIHYLNDDFSISGLFRYIDEKDRPATDLRNPVESYGLVDVSARYQTSKSDLSYAFSVKNIFNEEYFLPSLVSRYPGDFQQEGRSVVFSLKKVF
ncbi:MAG: TonB-dependent receptor plug domain-containing protein [Gammaproteobacteria bacterium]|nr:TonB-dependent receptor plug domain-containing protein [Gammaproteobacteria bacterium]